MLFSLKKNIIMDNQGLYRPVQHKYIYYTIIELSINYKIDQPILAVQKVSFWIGKHHLYFDSTAI